MSSDVEVKVRRAVAELLQGVIDLSQVLVALTSEYDLGDDECFLLRKLSEKEFLRFGELMGPRFCRDSLTHKLIYLQEKTLIVREVVEVDRVDAAYCRAYGLSSTKEDVRYSLSLAGHAFMAVVGVECEQVRQRLKEDKRMVQAAKRAKHTGVL